MYWRAAFSEENLKDVVIKINGEAELFFRKKTDLKKSEHSKGSVLVNRTTRDGLTIPNEVYYELCKYANEIVTELSERAKEYADCICTRKAPYDIIKDRRFTEDKMLFHIPLTFNFKSSKKEKVNDAVIDKIREDREVMILGIDRGERNLIYYSLIDSSGKIVDQDSLNIIDGVNYWEKLDVREKTVRIP
jgi:CRISPR-associated protein Cpf1